MGGEWPNLEIMPEAEVIVLNENNKVNKIFSPMASRQNILEVMHKSRRKFEAALIRIRLHYTNKVLCRTSINMLSLVPSSLSCNQARHRLGSLG